MIERLVITETVGLVLTLLEDDSDRMSLIHALVKKGRGEEVDKSEMYSKVAVAYDYLTSGDRVIYIGDSGEFN